MGIERTPEVMVKGLVKVIVPVAVPRDKTPVLFRVIFPVKAPPPARPVPAITWVELGVMACQVPAEEILLSAKVPIQIGAKV